ncbi:MAG: DUF2314 domain-containing protein [Planctomycetes bacterium]|nr:DUF2314 domain-containing protein [Planctomycetota bacterium]
MSEDKSGKKIQSTAINVVLFLTVAVIAFRNNPVWVNGRPSGVALLVALLGLLCVLESFRKTTWGRWTGAIVTLAVAGTLLGLELSLLNIALAVVCLVSLIRYIPDREDDKPMRSLVLLLKEPHYVEGPMMAGVASRAWDCEVTYESSDDDDDDDDEDGTSLEDSPPFLIGEEPPFFCSNYPAMLTIHSFAAPYFDDPEAVADDVHEARIRTAILEHTAWISCDLITWLDEETDEAQADDLIGRLLAEFADDNCLAVIDLFDQSVYPFIEDETEAALRSGNPRNALEQLPYDPVITISPDDPEMQAAVQTARDRWPEFVEAFENREDGQHFAMKARFEENDHIEFMWIKVTAIEGELVLGILDSDPADVHSLQCGDRVRVTLDKLNDWMYLSDDEQPVGGFTVAVLTKRQRGE